MPRTARMPSPASATAPPVACSWSASSMRLPICTNRRRQHGQDDPLVAIAPGSIAVRGADGIAVTGFAVDPFAFMAIDSVVADETYHAVGQDIAKQEVGKQDAQLDAGPGGGGEDALIAGRMAVTEGAEGAQQVSHGAAAGRQHGGGHQEG